MGRYPIGSFLGRLIVWLSASLIIAATPATAKVALWQIEDGDTHIWLLGTMHALPPEIKWHSPAIDKAISSADGLVLETIIEHDPVKTAGLIQSLGIAPGLPPLAERVDPAKRQLLAQMIAESHVPPAIFDKMKTWAAAFLLAGLRAREIGASAESGVESELTQRFSASGRPVTGLETLAEQLGFFNTLSEAEQRRFLADTVDTQRKDKSEFAAMINAWLRGDDKAIAKTFAREDEISPLLREVLIRRRNAAWARWLAKRLQQPGQVLVAVGAGHLAGPESVQRQLAARKIKVTRVN